MEVIYKFLGGRKMTLMIFLLLITAISLIMNKVSMQDCGMFMLWLYGIYTVGNAVEHMSPHVDPTKEK
jgi:hypothetical protein